MKIRKKKPLNFGTILNEKKTDPNLVEFNKDWSKVAYICAQKVAQVLIVIALRDYPQFWIQFIFGLF